MNELVEREIEEFMLDLRNALEQVLIAGINHVGWEQTDYLDEDSLGAIEHAIAHVFWPILRRYDTAVMDILLECRTILQHGVWLAMNVPYPRNVDGHIDRVIDNSLVIAMDLTADQLETEMLKQNWGARRVQRAWRRAISNPTHPACRRRLAREFEEMCN